ncbi:hypothetical protein QR680_012791 [Steinernema hermaphroditum]|uniref:Protein kinase domain-containing protein n=1 Tax=Steinernema hermaphroditum TaxID=289476 RepID=A0AA39M161_9BILA|nr:hypothetical protein QR680_012791 [Steinernema hermaphroditum]
MSFFLNLLEKWTRRQSPKILEDNVSVSREASDIVVWSAIVGSHRKRRIDEFLHSLVFYFSSWLDDADLQRRLVINPHDAFLITWPRQLEERSPAYRKWHLVLMQKDAVVIKVKVVWRKRFVMADDKTIGLDEFIKAQGLRMLERPWHLRPEQITQQLSSTPNLEFPMDFPLGRIMQKTMNFDADRRIPVITIEVVELSAEAKTMLVDEAERYRHFGSRRIWRLWSFASPAENALTLVLEDISCGSLTEYIRSSFRAPQQLRNFAIHIAEGLRYLEKRGVVHRRLSLDVCLLTYAHNVKLAFFGLSEERLVAVDDNLEDVDRCRWVPPECLPYMNTPRMPYDSSSMVYSFGSILWSMFHGALLPYENEPSERIKDRAFRLEYPQLAIEGRLMPDEMAAVTLRCWNTDPLMRGGCKELKKTLRNLREHAQPMP